MEAARNLKGQKNMVTNERNGNKTATNEQVSKEAAKIERRYKNVKTERYSKSGDLHV